MLYIQCFFFELLSKNAEITDFFHKILVFIHKAKKSK